MATRTLYAAYPSAVVYAPSIAGEAQPPAKLKALKHLLWGDWLSVTHESADGKFYYVKVRGEQGWMRAEDTQPNRLLEIVFVDIGQGDGALVVTPQDKRFIIDAGQGDNMFRFLRWRFGFKTQFTFDAAIISHSDADHYGGFDYFFKEAKVHFKTVYSNGLMERAAASTTDALGPRKTVNGKKYITDLVTDLAGLQSFLSNTANWKGKKYPGMLAAGLADNRFDDFRMLAARDGHLPGYEAGQPLSIEVLGPGVEQIGNADALRWFGDVGRTKNGHSVALRFKMKNVSIFMGGDLNLESSRFLLEFHTGLPSNPTSAEEETALIQAARPHFASDVAKACHHGSADTLLPLMKAINPAATVISSGDDEPYAHPRADALGAIAKCSRGDRPLLLSTELARSAKESIKHPAQLRAQITDLAASIAAETNATKRAALQKKFDALIATLERSIAVYGAINLRTDGDNVVLAYKLEQSTPTNGWDIYQLEPAGANGPLMYVSKYD